MKITLILPSLTKEVFAQESLMAALLSKLIKAEGTMTRISAIEVLGCREQASLGDNSGTHSFDQIRSLIPHNLSFDFFDISVIVTVKVNEHHTNQDNSHLQILQGTSCQPS